ncbi:Translation initiation factor eIF-2B subunit gamma [Ranunculus cassubicifolius]
MQNLQRLLSRISISPSSRKLESILVSQRAFLSTDSGGGSEEDAWGKEWDSVGSSEGSGFGFDSVSSWSTGLTEMDFEGKAEGLQVAPPPGSTGEMVSRRQSVPSSGDEVDADIAALEKHNQEFEAYVKSWPERMQEVNMLLKQVNEPGVRGSYLKDSEKAEMYRLHKENPEVYTIEKLAKDYRIMRQRVHAILWLKEEEEKEEKELGHPLDDSVELLLDTCPEFFNSHDREFHVATLPYKPDFKIMPEGWDGTTRDLDEVHYEISMKEDEMLYQEFVQRMNFNKKKMAGEVKVHKYSRRRSAEGWNFTVEKLGPRGKRGGGGGWKFVSLPDGSSRPLNEMEKMYVKRETVKRRRKILP